MLTPASLCTHDAFRRRLRAPFSARRYSRWIVSLVLDDLEDITLLFLAAGGGQDLYANATPAAERAPAPAAAAAPAPAAAAAAPAPAGGGGGGEDYESMGRLKLVKICREKGLDYKPVSSDKPALIRLLQAALL